MSCAPAQEIAGSTQLQLTTVGSILSIAFFNFFGISVTKNLSGAARCTIDACRTLFVWMFSLYAGWETFHGLEVSSILTLILTVPECWVASWKTCLAHWPQDKLYKHCAMLQVVGFVVLVCGTSLYNELIRSCLPAVYESTVDSDLEVSFLGGFFFLDRDFMGAAFAFVPGDPIPP